MVQINIAVYGGLYLIVADESRRFAARALATIGLSRAISSQMESSDGSEIAVKQNPKAADPMQSDRKPLLCRIYRVGCDRTGA